MAWPGVASALAFRPARRFIVDARMRRMYYWVRGRLYGFEGWVVQGCSWGGGCGVKGGGGCGWWRGGESGCVSGHVGYLWSWLERFRGIFVAMSRFQVSGSRIV